jgi:3-hydroxy-9,10-secoandrosta-1,3,5(10)-triene-9,17-dione monooxygenase reductase component
MTPGRPTEGRAEAGDGDRVRRRVLWALPTGLYLVGTAAGGRWNLMTASWVVQVATAPPRVAVSVETGAVTLDLAGRSGAFAVSLLERSQRSVVRRFVKPVTDVERGLDGLPVSLAGEPVAVVAGEVPVLAAAWAWLACQLTDRLDLGSHHVLVGEVVDVGAPGEGGEGETGSPLRMEDTRMHYGG